MVSRDAVETVLSQTTPLQTARQHYQPRLPALLVDLAQVSVVEEAAPAADPSAKALFPNSFNKPLLRLKSGKASASTRRARRVGVVFSGGQAPGGHNVIAGLYDALKQQSGSSQLFGFRNGPSGLLSPSQNMEIDAATLQPFRNQGGFDLIGSGRTKIETPEQFEAVKKTVAELRLDALVIVGGDDSNTNAAVLAETFLDDKIPCQVIGVPKTIDGDLRNAYIEASFGFDTAARTFSESIGNIARDALSARKYYHFIRVMGRSASHIALECALQTHPNLTLISEEIAHRKQSLEEIVNDICDVISRRAEAQKNYGVIVIPEGVIEFIPDCQGLIKELNGLVGKQANDRKLEDRLSSTSKACFVALPKEIQDQLLLDRDPHGNVQVSKIESERLFIHLVEAELRNRQKKGVFKGKFSAQPHFFGYEGRAAFPSNFDSDYCYTLGMTAAVLIESGATGYVVFVQGLAKGVQAWQPGGYPLAAMIHFEERQGKKRPVIQKALVDLGGSLFKHFVEAREQWAIEDAYRYPGPIQFFGPPEIADALSFTIKEGKR